jgi:protein TonB
MITKNNDIRSFSLPHFLLLCFLFLSLKCNSVYAQNQTDSTQTNELNTKPVDASLDYFHDTTPHPKIEQPIIYPGCQVHKNNDDVKKCLYSKLFEHVHNNVNSALFNDLELKDQVNVYVRFKVNANGDVKDVEARSPYVLLNQESERVVKLLPKMKPAKAGGKSVTTVYTLPITFQAYEESQTNKID